MTSKKTDPEQPSLFDDEPPVPPLRERLGMMTTDEAVEGMIEAQKVIASASFTPPCAVCYGLRVLEDGSPCVFC